MTTPDGSWLSMFVERGNEPDYDDGLGGWLTARLSRTGEVITVVWESENHESGPATVERWSVRRID